MRARPFLAGLAMAAALALPAADAAAQRRAARPAARPAAAQDWTRVAARTPEGVRLGNPAARVRLVEYGSITCPHCAAFSNQGGTAGLLRHIRTGLVSWEYRPYMIFPTDPGMFAALNCLAPSRFFPVVEQLYATQRTWAGRVQAYLEANQQQVVAMSPAQRALAMFRASQTDGLFRASGLTAAQLNACVGNIANLRRVAENTRSASQRLNIPGTPTFFINGAMTEPVELFSQLEPMLIRAGARP